MLRDEPLSTSSFTSWPLNFASMAGLVPWIVTGSSAAERLQAAYDAKGRRVAKEIAAVQPPRARQRVTNFRVLHFTRRYCPEAQYQVNFTRAASPRLFD
jgi:hypothetical protein